MTIRPVGGIQDVSAGAKRCAVASDQWLLPAVPSDMEGVDEHGRVD